MKKFLSTLMVMGGLLFSNSIVGSWHLERVDTNVNGLSGFLQKLLSSVKFNADGSCVTGEYIKKCYKKDGNSRYRLYNSSGEVRGEVILNGNRKLHMATNENGQRADIYFHRVGKSAIKRPKRGLKLNRVYYARVNGKDKFLLFKKSGNYYYLSSNKSNHTQIRDFKNKIRGRKTNLHNYSYTHDSYIIRNGKYYSLFMGFSQTPIEIISATKIKFDNLIFRLK